MGIYNQIPKAIKIIGISDWIGLDYIINPDIILLWFPYQNRTFSN